MLHIRRVLMLAGGIALAIVSTLFIAAPPAWAADQNFLKSQDVHYLNQCGRFWPSTGMFQTTHVGGGAYDATLRFRLTQAEKNALSCVGPYLELDFRLFGFNTPSEWDGYSVYTDIPGAIHDTAKSDGADEATPAVTRIKASELTVDHEYYATVSFFGLPLSGAPQVSIQWVPSYWASSAPQKLLCATAGLIYGDAMCIFGKTRVYLSDGYNNNAPLIFDGYRVWQFNPISPTSASPPSVNAEPLPVVQNYKADRTILHAPNGTLYVMAGGAKFYFSSMNQFSNLGYSTAGMVSLSNEALATIPDVPRDGTILRGGGGQVYTVAGGAKFHFGSMTEYYAQGYTNGQMINVPQAPLDAVGDAPGNRPSDGAVLQHPDGRLYVISGGVKFYFGSMTEFASLGYSASHITRVAGAPLDAIPLASTVSPPRDGTTLRGGGGQIYVMAGGAKFHFGSMAEYQAQGAQLTDWVNVPQGSLDAIGDAPGNMPRNGTVVQRPDGAIFVITGGVRWYFGSMSEYYQLGYADSRIMRVSQAPLDGIRDASPSYLPANETLLQGNDATVWVMKAGVRRSFTSMQQLASLGYSAGNIVRVPGSILATIPSGGNL